MSAPVRTLKPTCERCTAEPSAICADCLTYRLRPDCLIYRLRRLRFDPRYRRQAAPRDEPPPEAA